MERIPDQTEAGAYNRAEVAVQALSEAREKLSAVQSFETGTPEEKIKVIAELADELSVTKPGTDIPEENGNRHLVEALSVLRTDQEQEKSKVKFRTEHPELETV